MRVKAGFLHRVVLTLNTTSAFERDGMVEWLENHVGACMTDWDVIFWGTDRADFGFAQRNHAVLFKLTWGGR